MIKVILEGNPRSTNTIYRTHGHIVYMTHEGRNLKKFYQQQAQFQCKETIGAEVSVNIFLYFGDKRKRDWDNYHKLAMDALNGIAWEDDSQIKRAFVEMLYDKDNPRIEICIFPLE